MRARRPLVCRRPPSFADGRACPIAISHLENRRGGERHDWVRLTATGSERLFRRARTTDFGDAERTRQPLPWLRGRRDAAQRQTGARAPPGDVLNVRIDAANEAVTAAVDVDVAAEHGLDRT